MLVNKLEKQAFDARRRSDTGKMTEEEHELRHNIAIVKRILGLTKNRYAKTSNHLQMASAQR